MRASNAGLKWALSLRLDGGLPRPGHAGPFRVAAAYARICSLARLEVIRISVLRKFDSPPFTPSLATPLFKNLIEHIHHIGIGFLDLVEQMTE